jgi:hypothetical protein
MQLLSIQATVNLGPIDASHSAPERFCHCLLRCKTDGQRFSSPAGHGGQPEFAHREDAR